MERESLTQLVDAVRAGDADAWTVLVRRLGPTVGSALMRYDVDPEVRADAAGEVWRVLFERIETVRNPERLHGWTAVVASNAMISVLRKAKRKHEVSMTAEVIGELNPVGDVDEVVGSETRAALEHAVSKLSEREQTVIRCRVLTDDPEPLQAIEQRHGIPAGSVGPTLGRGLTKLRRDPELMKFFSLPAA